MTKWNQAARKERKTARRAQRVSQKQSKKKYDVPGRPPRNLQDEAHQAKYENVRKINEIIGYLCLLFSTYQNLFREGETQTLQSTEKTFNMKELDQKVATPEQILIFGSKFTLPYWIDYLVKKEEKTTWSSNEMLDAILFWFHYQRVLPQEVFDQVQKWKGGSFDKELFRQDPVKDNSLINLMVILVIDLGSFADISLLKPENSAKYEFQLESTLEKEAWMNY